MAQSRLFGKKSKGIDKTNHHPVSGIGLSLAM